MRDYSAKMRSVDLYAWKPSASSKIYENAWGSSGEGEFV